MTIHQFMYKHLQDPVIIEAGACDGSDTLIMSNMFPNGKIYSFEPVPALFERTKERLKNKNNVKIYNMALSDKTGEQPMHVAFEFDKNCGSSSLLNPKLHLEYYKRITFEEKINVKTIRLDEFLKNENIKKVNFMWLDMQGYEPFVLQNSPEALKITDFIHTETQNTECYEGGMLTPKYIEFLQKSGFVILFDNASPYLDGGDLTLIRKELYDKKVS